MAPESEALRRVVRETVLPAGPRLSDVLCEVRMLQPRASWLPCCCGPPAAALACQENTGFTPLYDRPSSKVLRQWRLACVLLADTDVSVSRYFPGTKITTVCYSPVSSALSMYFGKLKTTTTHVLTDTGFTVFKYSRNTRISTT